ncbi:MAG: hypothetical protein ACRDQA_10430 [Nocardioidaceae bacterium]
MTPGELHTVEEVAEHFGLNPEYLQRLVGERKVPHLRPHRLLARFTDEHVRQMEKTFEVKPMGGKR